MRANDPRCHREKGERDGNKLRERREKEILGFKVLIFNAPNGADARMMGIREGRCWYV